MSRIRRRRWCPTTCSRRTCHCARRVEREGGGWGVDRLRDTGELAGTAEALDHSERAERNEPILRTHDRYGNRVDEVELDPVLALVPAPGDRARDPLASWRDPQPGAHAVRAALFFVWSQVNSGVMCPVSMTYSAIPRCARSPSWRPSGSRASQAELRRRRARGHGDDREAGRLGRAREQHPRDPERRRWEITGHKWFCSYPSCDLFLTLAQAPAGLSCFLIEGRDPGFRIQRLKDKLGTRSLPSSEVEFQGVAAASWARRDAGCRRSSGWSTTRGSTA